MLAQYLNGSVIGMLHSLFHRMSTASEKWEHKISFPEFPFRVHSAQALESALHTLINVREDSCSNFGPIVCPHAKVGFHFDSTKVITEAVSPKVNKSRKSFMKHNSCNPSRRSSVSPLALPCTQQGKIIIPERLRESRPLPPSGRQREFQIDMHTSGYQIPRLAYGLLIF